jgi:two-component system, NarL family, nitrate/nitrite response regulator NarL
MKTDVASDDRACVRQRTAAPPVPVVVMSRPCVHIVIADEQPIFRDGLRRLLETAPDLRIVGEADISEVTALVQGLRPDILLLSLSPSSTSTIDALQRMAAAGVRVRTILLTRSVDGPEILNALRFGAYGVVPKDTTAEMLFKTIESVMAGHYWVGRERVSNVAVGVRQLGSAQRRSKAFGLSHRELEIVRAVMKGDTNKEIARRFSISENTVKRHLTHIFDKVGASTRVELALFAAHHRLFEGS